MSSYANDKLLTTAEEAAGGAFHLFWGSSLATLFSAICVILVARLLGPEQYGIYSLTLIVSSFLMLFTDYGVSQALTRFIALYRSRNEWKHIAPLLKIGLAFNLATSSIMFLIGFILADPLTNLLINRLEIVYLVRITLILVLIQPLSTTIGCALLGFGDMKGCAIIDIVRQAVRVVISPLLIVLGFSILGAVVGYVVAFIVGFTVSLILIYRHYRQVKDSNSKKEAGKTLLPMITYGMPLYLSNIVNSFAGTLRGVILAYFTTNMLIGNFQTAMNFATLISLISSPVATALFPAFSKLGVDDGEAKIMFTYSVKYSAALIIPATVFVSIMSRDLVFLLYDVSYSYAPLYLTLYAVTFLFAALGSTVLGSFFSGVGNSKVNFKATLLSVGFFTPSAIVLASIFQVEGIIIAVILATATSTLYSLWIAIHKYRLRIDLKSSVSICFASLLAAAPIIPLALYSSIPRIVNLVLAALLYLAIYLTATPLLRILTRKDLEALNHIFSKVTVLRPIVRIIISYENKIIKLIKSEA